MKAPNLATKAQNMPTGIRRVYRKKQARDGPSSQNHERRAREIHIERGDHVCDMDNYLG